MVLRGRFGRCLAFVMLTPLLSIGLTVAQSMRVEADVVVRTRAAEVSAPIERRDVRRLPFAATHVAVHWTGHPDAEVTVAFSADGSRFGPVVDAGRDDVGEQRGNGQTYGALLPAGGAIAVQLQTDRPISRLSVLALADGERIVRERRVVESPAGAAVVQPAILSRVGWGADETLRFDAAGNEIWPPTFWPIQKLLVHHTATTNNDPDPAATVRSIYYYHAVTQGWGDIGYNFLIDEKGVIYKGRHSHSTSSADTITGEDDQGNGVTAGHAYGFNAGTVGVALLGTFTGKDATSAAKNALVDFLAWKAGGHGIDPKGSSVYVNPVTGGQKKFPNIAGHRDVSATQCPGGTLYKKLPTIRDQVAARISSS